MPQHIQTVENREEGASVSAAVVAHSVTERPRRTATSKNKARKLFLALIAIAHIRIINCINSYELHLIV